jgi:hypothetical protein
MTSRGAEGALRASIGVVIGLILMACAPAALAARWSIVPVKAPVRHVPGALVPGALDDVSCPAAGTCIAVGGDGGPAAVAEELTGTSWSPLSTPSTAGLTALRANHTDATLEAVSCPSASSCIAVGSFVDATGATVALSETWNGSQWTLVPVPVPAPAGSEGSNLVALSCTSATACVAVGTDGSTTAGYSAIWNGSSWATQPMATGSPAANGISCTSGDDCEAVGNGPSAQIWNGSTWTAQAVSAPSNALSAQDGGGNTLSSVACTSASFCIAVGSYFDPNFDGDPYSEVWNGTSWSITSIPGMYISLTSVACTASSACTAVGLAGIPPDQGEVTSGAQMAAVSWNGTSWSARPTGSTTGTFTSEGISCAGTMCEAVGSLNGEPLGETTSGGGFTMNSPEPAVGPPGPAIAGSGLSAVSCSTPRACTAVGGDGGALVERMSGRRWTAQSLALPAGMSSLSLDAVACPGLNACEAVGSTTGELGQIPLAEAWNGSGWSQQATAVQQSAADLAGVSCQARSRCIAVGSYTDPDADQVGFSEALSAGSWSLQPLPGDAGPGGAADLYPQAIRAEARNPFPPAIHPEEQDPTPTTAQLDGVSCARTTCIAVGSYVNPPNSGSSGTYATLAEQWNGMSWSALHPSNRRVLTAISCASVHACLAVNGGADAQRWNGHTWSFIQFPDARSLFLGAVSCPTTATCVLAGTEKGRVSVWRWHAGRMTSESVPNPRRAVFVSVTGISCASTNACVAVGTYAVHGGARYPLVERYG